MTTGNFEDDHHALSTGFLLGTLLKCGIDARPLLDEDGDYTDVIEVNLSEEMGEDFRLQVRVLSRDLDD